VDDSPFAVKSGMVEVFQTATIMEIQRSSIIDFAFILPHKISKVGCVI
jgi:hypothetical protein